MSDWSTLSTEAQAKKLQRLVGKHLKVYSANKVRYRQMTEDFILKTKLGRFTGRPGDYLITDASGGQVVLTEKLFQKIL